jgi:hypothetical protein
LHTRTIHRKYCRPSQRGFHCVICKCRRTALFPILQFSAWPNTGAFSVLDAFFEAYALDDRTDRIDNAPNSLVSVIQSLEVRHRISPNYLRREALELMVRHLFLAIHYEMPKKNHVFAKPCAPSTEYAFLMALIASQKVPDGFWALANQQELTVVFVRRAMIFHTFLFANAVDADWESLLDFSSLATTFANPLPSENLMAWTIDRPLRFESLLAEFPIENQAQKLKLGLLTRIVIALTDNPQFPSLESFIESQR